MAFAQAHTAEMTKLCQSCLHEDILLASPPAVARLDALVIMLAGAFCCKALFLVTMPV